MVYHTFSGEGCRSVGTMYGVDQVAAFRVVRAEVRRVEIFLDNSLLAGRILGTPHRLVFGTEWQADGKVVRVTETFARKNEVYNIRLFPTKDGEPVECKDIYVENVLEKRNRVMLCSKYLPTNNIHFVAKVLAKAQRIAGTPYVLEVDTVNYLRSARVALGSRTLLVVRRKQGEAGELKFMEGYNSVMDRKLGSGIHGHSAWELSGIRIHYNFVERKSRLGGLTPMEHAGLPRLSDTNNWLPLMKMAREFERRFPEASNSLETRQDKLDSWLGLDSWSTS